MQTPKPNDRLVFSDAKPEAGDCQAQLDAAMAASRRFHTKVCRHGGDYQSIVSAKIARIELTMIYDP
jgi:hypothetical protein